MPGSDDVRVGHQWVWTERTTYNPVGGLGDVYSTDLWRNLADPPIWNDPFTGIPQPFRADYSVETAGPEGMMDVPADAVTWDVTSKTWTPVAAGTTAVSKVTFDYASTSRQLASRPAHHHRRRGLLDRTGLRPRLRPREGPHRDRPGGDVASDPRDLQGLPPDR